MGRQFRAKILVVEDHCDSRDALGKLLRMVGYEVGVADGYQAALEAGKANRFDLVLCDIGLWDGDGCALLQELKRIQDIKGIAVTGYGMKDDVERCLAAGFKIHVLKPLHYENLLNVIDEVLDRNQFSASTSSTAIGSE